MPDQPMDAPLVSVVIPAYNAEQHLRSCVASVWGQTYEHWELIVVNDGSTDATLTICEELATRIPHRMRVISTENRGLSSARNTGIDCARGTLIALLDSDDLWLPEKLEIQVRLLESAPDAVAASCSFTRFLSDDPSLRADGHFDWTPSAVRKWLVQEGGGPALGSTLMIRSTTVAEVGCFNTELGSHAEDLEFACRLNETGRTVTTTKVLAGIRVWPGQIHGDLDAMENSLSRVFALHLTTEPRLRRRAEANLAMLMGTKQLLRGDLGNGARHWASAFRNWPVGVMRYPFILARKRRSSKLHRSRFGLPVSSALE